MQIVPPQRLKPSGEIASETSWLSLQILSILLTVKGVKMERKLHGISLTDRRRGV